MGRPKQLLDIQGNSLLVRTIQAVSATPLIHPTLVVLGAASSRIRPLVEQAGGLVVINPDWAQGLSTSVKAGLRAAQAENPNLDSILFCLADQPFLTTAALQHLLAARQATPVKPKLITARYEGHPGAPCWVHASVFPQINQLSGDQGLRPLFRSLPAALMAQVDLPELAADLDTPDDYQRAISDLG